jgi:hypothetical protein
MMLNLTNPGKFCLVLLIKCESAGLQIIYIGSFVACHKAVISQRRVRWVRYVARMGKKINAYRILVGKPDGKRPLGRPRHRLVVNINIDLREIGWNVMDWIDLAQDKDRDQWRALVNTIMNEECI